MSDLSYFHVISFVVILNSTMYKIRLLLSNLQIKATHHRTNHPSDMTVEADQNSKGEFFKTMDKVLFKIK